MCAAVSGITQKTTRSGSKIHFVTLEDDYGTIEGILFPRTTMDLTELKTDYVGAFSGTVSAKEDGEIKLLIDQFHALPEESSTAVETKKAPSPSHANKLYLRFSHPNSDEQKRVEALISLFPGSVKVYFYDGEYKQHPASFAISEYRLQVLREILGKDSVVLR